MMKASPKADVSPPATTKTATITSGKKMVQARLPFKTLSGAVPVLPAAAAPVEKIEMGATATVAEIIVATADKRKRKLSETPTVDDGIRPPKLNRYGSLTENDLLSSETLDSSVEFSIKSVSNESESKENVCVDNNDQIDDNIDPKELSNDEEADFISDNKTKTEPKAKKCLEMDDCKSNARKSKRIKDSNLITIKLPFVKKGKDAAKKAKKAQFQENDKLFDPVEMEMDDKEGSDEDDKAILSTENSKNTLLENSLILESKDSDKDNSNDISALNDSILSCKSVADDLTKTPVGQTLTPKQLQRRAESEKKLLEKQRAKEERERKLQEERELRQREKDEKERQKKKERDEKEEQRKKERDEKEEQRKREKEEREQKRLAEIEEREKKRQAEIEAKNEERRKKEEQKEEERKKKDEEKRLKEQAEQIKNRKTSEAFVKFFVPKKTDAKADTDANVNDDSVQIQNFMSFQVKDDMKVAPVTRRTLTPTVRTQLENNLCSIAVNTENLYLAQLKNGTHIPHQTGKTWLLDDDTESAEDELYIMDDVSENVLVINDKPKKQNYRAKFLKFHENRRPAYFGTWRKKSEILTPRKPFAQDTVFFDYEIDSDDEWEEEEPGESLHGSDDDEKDQESEDDYDIDNEFFVPHGHLSDEEIIKEDDLDEDNNPETQKAKLKFIQKEFADELNKKTEKLKPRLIGLIWQNIDGSQPSNCSKGIWDLLQARAFMFVGQSVTVAPPSSDAIDSGSDGDGENKNMSVRRVKITEKEVPDLIQLINGNQNNCNFLIKEFRAFVAKNQTKKREFSIVSIRNKIKELAVWKSCPEEGIMHKKMCWYVPIETRKRYGVDSTFPNVWNYTLVPKRTFENVDKEKDKEKEKDEKEREFESELISLNDSNSLGLSETVTSETVKQASMKPASFNIAKFIRVLSEDEKKKQFGSLTLRNASSEQLDDKSPASQAPSNGSKPSSSNVGKVDAGKSIVKKRANLLSSVPCGQDISPKLKNSLVTQFLNNNSKKRKASISSFQTSSAEISDGAANEKADVIVID